MSRISVRNFWLDIVPWYASLIDKDYLTCTRTFGWWGVVGVCTTRYFNFLTLNACAKYLFYSHYIHLSSYTRTITIDPPIVSTRSHEIVGRGNSCSPDQDSLRKGPTCSDTFASIQYVSARSADWTATFSPGPKEPQRLQPSIAEKGLQPSQVPQRK